MNDADTKHNCKAIFEKASLSAEKIWSRGWRNPELLGKRANNSMSCFMAKLMAFAD